MRQRTTVTDAHACSQVNADVHVEGSTNIQRCIYVI